MVFELEDTFKETSLEVYLGNIKENLPHITEHELGLINAFETGYNIGKCGNAPQLFQEAALIMLGKKRN